MVRRALGSDDSERPRYLEPRSPVIFPESAEMPESQLHLELRTILYQLLTDHLGAEVTVGSDQFVYFDAANPRVCVAPDVYVRLNPRGAPVRSWKTWERGSPEIAVEIISDDDSGDADWATKLGRYQRLGVAELVRFDPECTAGAKLRIWDRVDGSLLEREVRAERAPSLILNLDWVVAPADGFEIALRVLVPAGSQPEQLVLTRAEARRAEAEARRAEAEARRVEAEARRVEAEARRMETEARMAAEARVRELEAELARRPPERS
ncbi:MAG: Uma2 family endonuclease [Myxococcota bacterium]